MDTQIVDKPIMVRRRKRRIHPKDITVLMMIKNRSSIQEIVDALKLHSTNSIHRRLKVLEGAGLINPPPHARMARSRTLTDFGERTLAQYVTAKAEIVSGGTSTTKG